MQSKADIPTLRDLQVLVAKSWTLDSYSEAFRSTETPHRDFAHALLHVTKAAGKLAIAVDIADHKGNTDSFKPDEVNRFVADLVVCALRMASTCPHGAMDLQRAVEKRIAQSAAQDKEPRATADPGSVPQCDDMPTDTRTQYLVFLGMVRGWAAALPRDSDVADRMRDEVSKRVVALGAEHAPARSR